MRETAAYLAYVRISSARQTPKEPQSLLHIKLYNKSYFEAARSARNRSLLDVNEDFERKADAKRALLGNFTIFF